MHQLANYSKRIKLNDDEVQEYADRWYQTKDPALQELLVLNIDELVQKKVREFWVDARNKTSADYDDLLAEGRLGVAYAFRRYDPNNEGKTTYKFKNCVLHWVKAMCMNWVKSRGFVQIGRSVKASKVFWNLKKEYERFKDDPQCFQILSGLFNYEESDIRRILERMNSRDVSVDNVEVQGQNGERRLDLRRLSPPQPVEYLYAEETYHHFGEFYQKLEGREREIFDVRVMEGGDPDSTLDDLGNKYGISKERVRQLEFRLKCKLVDHFKKGGFSKAEKFIFD